MWLLKSIFIPPHQNIASKQKELGRKTKLHDWKEIISTQEEDIIELLQSCLPYQPEARETVELDEANQKLEDVSTAGSYC